MLSADLDQVSSLEEAKTRLQLRPYDLVLFQHGTGDADAVKLVAELHQSGISVPFILLTEGADEKTVAEIIEADTWNCVARSQIDGATLIRTIHNTLTLHSLQHERQAVEESLRKLSQAVEQ